MSGTVIDFFDRNSYDIDMVKKVKEYIEKMNLINPGDTVAIGVSGGADSVCLLSVLKELYVDDSVHLIAVHVNHNIRKEAQADEDYVRFLCEKMEVPFLAVSVDVQTFAKEHGVSTEEAGRMLRYQAFADALREITPIHQRIAVAHTMDDNAETMLLNLFRGSGVKGLGGIRPQRDHVIRPIRCLRRYEVEDYLHERDIDYCMDQTNEEDVYTRNRIRHHILPEAVSQINEKTIEKMNDTAEQIRMAEDYLGIQVRAAFRDCVVKQKGSLVVKVERYQELHTYMQTRLLHLCLQEVSGTAKDLSWVHVRDLSALFTMPTGRGIDLPYQIRAEKHYANVIIKKQTSEEGGEHLEPLQLCVPGITEMNGMGVIVSTIFDYNKGMMIPKDRYTKWFDYDKIDKALMIRTRQEKDFLAIDEDGNRQKLKSYMINEKIPAKLRGQCPLIAIEEHVLWVVGYRISSAYKITDETKKILEIRYLGGDSNGRDNQSYDF